MPNIPITEVQIVGIWTETVFFGAHLVTFGYCVKALLFKRNKLKSLLDVNWIMLSVTLFLLANATLDVVLGFYHLLKAFVFYTGQGGPTQELTNISDWINISRVYRCWVVHDRSLQVVVFPIFLWFGCLGMSIWLIYLEGTLRGVHARVLLSSSELTPAGTAYWAFTIGLNFVTTGLIVWRIWTVEKSCRFLSQLDSDTKTHAPHNHLRSVMLIIVESGLLYSTAAFISFVTFVLGSVGIYIITDVEVQIVGIAFNLIIIRASSLKQVSVVASRASQTIPLQFANPRARTFVNKTVTVTNDTFYSINHIDLGIEHGSQGGLTVNQ
ncbi:hypothetical protein GALMADRAFT_74438 [Galerina marginata CBS 339.88]|uniref:Uncharacterized protein n=1 Tax=Galerina marginata (strain CBS 339.88) TaxID=685588 RepID=A0A067SWP5_GALM3|nr:hypothetical protein GALMADRAFT_74438 [Galerina marginata CBS 339.88]